jgi:hypothetical protein
MLVLINTPELSKTIGAAGAAPARALTCVKLMIESQGLPKPLNDGGTSH